MTFPSNAILDTFDRADNASMGANWPGRIQDSGTQSPKILNNYMQPGPSDNYSDAYWINQFAKDQEAFFTVGLDGPESYLFVKIQNPGTATAKAYYVDSTGGSGTAVLYKLTSGHTSTSIASWSWTATPAAGDKIGITAVDNGSTVTLTVYQNRGSGWVSLGTGYTDSSSPILGPAYIGLAVRGGGMWANDFGGGSTDLGVSALSGITLNSVSAFNTADGATGPTGWAYGFGQVAKQVSSSLVNNTTNFQSVGELGDTTLDASKTYAFRVVAFFETAAAADFKCRMTFVGATQVRAVTRGMAPGDTAHTIATEVVNGTVLSTIALVGNNTGGGVITYDGVVVYGSGSAREFIFEYSQNSQNASDTKLYQGAWVAFTPMT